MIRLSDSGHVPSTEVLICGGGPVGLLLANRLGQAGVSCTVLEQRTERPAMSMAIGITPPSLRILGRLGLDTAFVRRGIRVERAYVHENGEVLGDLSFDSLPGQYRYILSLPQADGIEILHQALERYSSVTVLAGHEAVGHHQDDDGVTVCARHGETDIRLRGSFLVGCDGHQSAVRKQSGLRHTAKTYRPRFMMADFEDRTEFGESAHLFFGRRGSVESFPLPHGMRRWIVQAGEAEWAADPLEVVRTRVLDQTGVDVHDLPHAGPSRFGPRRALVHPYYRGRVVLCGDAAHVMSPIGGQGMNTGFADAEMLASVLTKVLRDGEAAAPLLEAYSDIRTASFRVASARAARGMWLGTRTGVLGSAFRRALITHILFRSSVRNALPAYFAMLDLPFNTADAARPRR